MTAAEKVLQAATDRALDIISNAEQKAKHNLASAAADAKKVTDVGSGGDHDLLMVLKTMVERIAKDIAEFKATNELKADQKELDELSKNVYTDREKRMRHLENTTAAIWVAISIYTAINLGMIGLIASHLLK